MSFDEAKLFDAVISFKNQYESVDKEKVESVQTVAYKPPTTNDFKVLTKYINRKLPLAC